MAKKMIQFSPELFSLLSATVEECGLNVAKKKMFGHETFFLNGYMFSGANVNGIFVNVGEKAKQRALENETGVGLFEPMEGMVLKDYLLLSEQIYSDHTQLKKWLDRSSEYLLSLPLKKKKDKK